MKQSRAGVVATVALHGAFVGALLSYQPARSALAAAAPIMVDWIAAPKPEPVIETPKPPKPRPVHHRPRPVEKPKIVAAPAESPSPSPAVVPAPPPPPPEPVALAAPAPAPEPLVVAPVFSIASLQNPKPDYPRLSTRLREEGRVVLRVLVDANGKAQKVEVQTSSGFPRLDAAAIDVVKERWKFVPAKRGNEVVSGWVDIPFNFKLAS